ncbi:hypothetical protein ACDF64_02240 [Agromyces sp. MMS24-JH15]|uniref:hypothetical protein n=1 Tax=Agromyces sp. MMS24-JH15 TaxID=3243765 RepID=UPI0037496FF6
MTDTSAIPAATPEPTTGSIAAAAAVAPDRAPAPPSVHVRTFLTWLAIFPLVALGLTLVGPVSASWNPVLRAFVLTIVIVPTASYLVLPRLLRAWAAVQRRRTRR